MKAALLLIAMAVCGVAAGPGGLSGKDLPQFVLLTHDDSVNGAAVSQLNRIAGDKDANGCPVTGTLFALVDDTSCGDLKELYRQGWEVAVHAKNHATFKKLTKEQIAEQVVGGRAALAACGIPEDSIRGHRSPFLETKGEVYEVLDEAGFLYDSTQIETTKGGGFGSHSWPGSRGGVREVPLWDLSATGTSFTMDYGDDEYGSGVVNQDVYEVLKTNFDQAYGGARSPMPLFIHTPYLQQNGAAVERFIDEVRQLPDVYFVTLQQLLAWMDNPIVAAQLTPEALGCGNSGGAPGTGEGKKAAEEEAPVEEETPEEELSAEEEAPEEEAPVEEDKPEEKPAKKDKKQKKTAEEDTAADDEEA